MRTEFRRFVFLVWFELIALSIDLVCDVSGVYRGPSSRGYLFYNADHKHWLKPLTVKIAPMGSSAKE